ncbi:MAG: TonB-dependent siderophore receptor [Gammaproteobacteria bacterium]
MSIISGGLRSLLAAVAAVAVTSTMCFESMSLRAQQRRSIDTTADTAATFNIPAQPLASALNRFGDVTGLQIVYAASLAEGRQSSALVGVFKAQDALARLLANTGLEFRFTDAHTVIIQAGRNSSETRTLGPVRVEGSSRTGTAGTNGSTDPTATEGTRSYTSSALSIASKLPQSIKDTPQSVSVITQQRMQDQNLTDFTSAMNQATGVTLVTTNSLQSTFYSRGFAINNIQIDGGAPLAMNLVAPDGSSSHYFPLIDMAQYDHVEVLRGADGLFNGYGDPSGSVNLTRKRPLDHAQEVVEGQIGSWNNYRAVVDATAPLAFDGRLRGRAVMSYEDQDYFYDTATNSHTLLYGILETDLTPSTLVSAGLSFTRQDSLPWIGGLPRYQNGADLKLPRSACLCSGWSRWNFETTEVFAQAEQHLGENWSLKLNLTRNDQESHQKYSSITGTVNPVTGSGPTFLGTMADYASVQTLADFTVNGAFELFGQRQQIVFGGNWQDLDSGGLNTYGALYAKGRAVDVFNFKPSDPAYAEPAASELSGRYPEWGVTQWGAYVNARLTFWGPLHLITGLRVSHYQFDRITETICTSADVAVVSSRCTAAGQVRGAPNVKNYGSHDTSWPPTVSLVYDLRKNLSLYASYTDIYLSQATFADQAHNPLDPVTGSNYEAGLKVEGFGGKLNATIAAYRIEQKNQAVSDGGYVPLPNFVACCYRNGNQVNLSRGIDAEVTGALLPGLQMSAGYTYNINEYRGSDYYASYYGDAYDGPRNLSLVSRVPKHLLKLWTSYQFQGGEQLRRLSVSGGVNAQTASYNAGSACIDYTYGTSPTGSPTATCTRSVPYNYTQGAYAIFSGRLAYKLDSRWSAAFNVNNVTNRLYYQTTGSSSGGNWYGEPRNVVLTLRGSF